MPVVFMEELQLALTAARVEQKNFGLWLKSWQVGQVLQALVTDKLPSSQIVLRVDGHQITATADIPVQKGAVLSLEVKSLDPVPTLKIINAPVMGSGQPAPLRGEIQLLLPQLLPHQGRVTDPFLTLLNPLQSANILSLLGLKRGDIERLIKQISRKEQLVDPAMLKAAVEKSGLFLESQLQQLIVSGGTLPPGDLKAELLRLLSRVQRKLREARATGDPDIELEPLLTLERDLEGAIAKITLRQLEVCQGDESGKVVWSFDIPLKYKDEVVCLSLSVYRDGEPPRELEKQQDWRATLSLTVPNLGPIEADVFLRGQKVSVVIFAEQDHSAQLIQGQIEQLKMGLESRGLEVSVLLSRTGSGSSSPKSSGVKGCVDERI
jgi:hypothetical protein